MNIKSLFYPIQAAILLASLTFISAERTNAQEGEVQYIEEFSHDDLTNRTIDQNLPVGKSPSGITVTQTGALSYTVPIRLPSGTKGMTPNISLVYNSQGSNGLLGFGWSLSGGSAISRVNKTLYHDQKVRNAQNQIADRLALDGNRLIVLEGNYGEDGTVYGTEIETFQKIVSHGSLVAGADWFSVETKNGIYMEFGKTANSKVMNTKSGNVLS